MGEECWSDYRQKLEGWRKARPRFEALLEDWENQKARMRELVLEPGDVVEALASAGHPLLFEELNVSVPESEARWAFHNAHLMHKRFSSGDLLFYLGIFEEAFTDQVLTKMRELVESARVRQA